MIKTSEEYFAKLIMAIASSSLSAEKQEELITKIQNQTFSQQNLDVVLQTMQKDTEAMKFAKQIWEERFPQKIVN